LINKFISAVIEKSTPEFESIQKIALTNFKKVMSAFRENGVAPRHFSNTFGYGYDDIGRDTLDRVLADIFKADRAIVTPYFASGTHALSNALFSILRPGDTLLEMTGKPYDTLEEVIGISGNSQSSLKAWGVKYAQVDLKNGLPDYDAIREAVRAIKPRVAAMQRSAGYAFRTSLTPEMISNIVKIVREESKDTLIFTDNCYGEFTQTVEPIELGVDLCAGSLIKNLGGGIAPTGGYAAGSEYCMNLVAERLTSPGIGREVGSYAYGYKDFYEGLFFAPSVVEAALKMATMFSHAFSMLGYEVAPLPGSNRSDIIQAIKTNSEDMLIEICKAVQFASPVESNVVPMPWDMPGYQHKVIMAAGSFAQGASIELSADGPIKPPYNVFIQGGLTFEHALTALEEVLTRLYNLGLIKIPDEF